MLHREIGPWRLGALMIAGLGDTSDPGAAEECARSVLARFCPDCWGQTSSAFGSMSARNRPGPGGQRVIGQPGSASTNVRLL